MSVYIPNRINVGYCNRSDTYTGKLGYVIYYDEKGKLRKENSWNGWRNKELGNDEFENIPTEGFVINKNVGGVSRYSSWCEHGRIEKVRIYDPRGFEFEITVPNLLWILECCDVIRGKGITSPLIYGWSGTELMLIPTETSQYEEYKKYSDVINANNKILAKDLIEGATYKNKYNQLFVYMGKFDYYSHGYQWTENGEIKSSKNYSDIPRKIDRFRSRYDYDTIDMLFGKYFWFACLSANGSFISFEQYKSISGKFIECINATPDPKYSEYYEMIKRNPAHSPRSSRIYINYSLDDFKQLYQVEYMYRSFYCADHKRRSVRSLYGQKSEDGKQLFCVSLSSDERPNLIDKKLKLIYKPAKNALYRSYYICDAMTVEEVFEAIAPAYAEVYLANGEFCEKECYYVE